MSQHHIILMQGASEESAIVCTRPVRGMCHLALTYRDRTVFALASDYFEAFCQVRQMLEQENILPHCYGASLSVYPSGMGRDMGAGLQAYRLKMGCKAQGDGLIGIFETGDDVIPATVEDQKNWFKAWRESNT